MLALCERFGCLPSDIYAEDSGFARMLKIEALVHEVTPANRADRRTDDET
jgi:hypothetical protein